MHYLRYLRSPSDITCPSWMRAADSAFVVSSQDLKLTQCHWQPQDPSFQDKLKKLSIMEAHGVRIDASVPCLVRKVPSRGAYAD